MKEDLPQDIEYLLRDLQADSIGTRKGAAEQLGQVSMSSIQIVQALVTVADSDPSFVIREVARESLHSPVHQEALQQYRHMLTQKIGDDSIVEKGLRSTGPPIIGAVFGAVAGAFVLFLIGVIVEVELGTEIDTFVIAGIGAIAGAVAGVVVALSERDWRFMKLFKDLNESRGGHIDAFGCMLGLVLIVVLVLAETVWVLVLAIVKVVRMPGRWVMNIGKQSDLKGGLEMKSPEISVSHRDNGSVDVGGRVWLNLIVAGFLGGLVIGAVGGVVGGFIANNSSWIVSGAIGGAVGGAAAGLIQVHTLKSYIPGVRLFLDHPWVWVNVAVAGVVWAMAVSWSGGVVDRAGSSYEVIGNNWTWVAAGVVAGTVGGAVVGVIHRQFLRQRLPLVANWWVLINTLGWAVSGVLFLSAFWASFLSFLGGGNPGQGAEEAIFKNWYLCRPVCLSLIFIVPGWIALQAILNRKVSQPDE